MDEERSDEASQGNPRSRSEDEENWSNESTRGSSISGSESALPNQRSSLSHGSRRPPTRAPAERLVPPRTNDGPNATTSALHNLGINADTSRFRGLTPPPLPLAVLPTKKRSLGTMLKDNSEAPQQPDKLSRELETMTPSYALEQRQQHNNNPGAATRAGPSYAFPRDEQNPNSTPRTLLPQRQGADEVSSPPEGERSGSGSPVSEVDQGNNTIGSDSSGSARVS